MTKQKLFFVYGTLKKGGFFAQRFDRVRKSVQVGTVRNMDMLHLGGFPGAVPGEGSIIGEVHEYDKADQVAADFDAIEGYNRNAPEEGLYNRIEVDVELESGKTVKATMYTYNHARGDERKVEDGVWKI